MSKGPNYVGVIGVWERCAEPDYLDRPVCPWCHSLNMTEDYQCRKCHRQTSPAEIAAIRLERIRDDDYKVHAKRMF